MLTLKTLHFNDQLETQQRCGFAGIPMVEDQGENDEEYNDENYENSENLIKDYKTSISYIGVLQKFFQCPIDFNS